MKKLFIYKLLIVVVMALIGAYFYNKLPNIVPTHWWIDGKPDQMWGKLGFIVMFPLMSLWLTLLFSFLPKLDPKKENYPKFEKSWEVFQFTILWFFAYIYSVSIYASLNSNVNMNQYMMIWMWLMFIILGNYMGKIRQNYFVGIKLPWTLANEEVWNKTHRLWGKMFMLAWLVFLANTFLLINTAWILWVLVTAILVVPVVYSYYIFKNINNVK